MFEQVNFSNFYDRFHAIRPNNFTYEGLRALFDYLESFEEDTGEKIELDVIALCCDYSEYKNLAELQENYTDIESMDDLKDHTTVIEIPDTEGFIIQNY